MKRPLYISPHASRYVSECRADALERLSRVRLEHDNRLAFFAFLLIFWILSVIALCAQ